jgi:hypothetical protein
MDTEYGEARAENARLIRKYEALDLSAIQHKNVTVIEL